MAIKTDTFTSIGGGGGAVTSVNTQTGAVVLSANDLAADHTATNYTAANANIDGHLSGIDSKLGTIAAGLTYKGTFNATAGTPDLSSAVKGDLYVIDTAGTIYGQTWAIGDHLLINEDMGGTITNSKIDKIDNTDQVTSVNTLTGAVVLSANDLAADHTAVNYTAANANIDGHLSGIDSALGASANPTLNDVTTNGDTTTNAINVGTITTSGDILADSGDTRTIGDEDTRFITYYGDMNGAIRFKAKNDHGSQITKGQVVYIKGLAGDGTTPTVALADADDSAKMPAFGLAFNTANDQAEVQIVSFGNLGGLNTSTFAVGDTLYVDTTAGGLTKTKPTGETAQLQNIGRVIRSNNGAGVIMVGGAGRSAATPNLDQDKVFLGNASNQSVSTSLSSIGLSKFNNDSGFLTNINSESINDLSDVTITGATSGEVLRYNGSAWVDATLAYSDLSGTPTNVSTFTNDAGYLTDITGESIGDLSDVTITTATNGQVLSYNGSAWVNSAASAGSLAGLSDVTITGASTGEVLRYNGSVWVDATLAYSDLSGTPTNVSTFTNDAGYLTGITGESIGDLSDVTITGASTGEVLRYNGSVWVDATLAYSDLSGTPTNVSTFTNDAGYLTGITGESIGDLSDVTITSASTGEVLRYNGSAWVDATLAYSDLSGTPTNVSTFTNDAGYLTGITGESIGDLSDVTITTATNGQVLTYNGSAWVNQAVSISAPTVTAQNSTATLSTPSAGVIEEVYTVNSASAVTLTLVSAVTVGEGFKYQIKRLGTGAVTVDPASTEYIDYSGQTTFSIGAQYDSITLISDGTNWLLI